MNRIILTFVGGGIVGAALAGLLINNKRTATNTDEPQVASRVVTADGEVSVRLDRETQRVVGLATVTVESVAIVPEIRAFGRVLDPAPLAVMLADRAGARSSLEISVKELQRLKLLHRQDQNVSARALEAAAAAWQRDQSRADAVDVQLMTGWGKSLAKVAETPAFLRGLASQEMAIVRVDIPLGTPLVAPVIGGRIAPATAPESPVETEFLGLAPSVDPNLQGQGFLFLQKNQPPAPGSAVSAWLRLGAPTKNVVLVPAGAVLRHNGKTIAYLQIADDLFQRRELIMGEPRESGWMVREGLKPGDRVVTVGSQQLLAEEQKDQNDED